MYLTEAWLQGAFGATQVAALCPDATSLATTIELAEAETEAALLVGGYTSATPSSVYTAIEDVPKQIKLAAYGSWLALAFARKVKPLPEELKHMPGALDDIRSGALQIEGVAKSGAAVVGGSTSTDTTGKVSDGALPVVFNRKTMTGFV